jgi:hypothetical protein
MTPQEITLLAVLLFLATVVVIFIVKWQRKQAPSTSSGTDQTDANAPAQWDWYDIAELARTAVKDAEQLWLKEGLPKQARLEHAISILVQAYPQLADYKPIATAFIREVIFNMNHPEQPAAPTAPQVLPMPDKPIASR